MAFRWWAWCPRDRGQWSSPTGWSWITASYIHEGQKGKKGGGKDSGKRS